MKLIRFFLYFFVALVLCICTLFALLQTKWAKEQIKAKIAAYLKEFGVDASIEELSGRLPFSWEIPKTDLRFNNGDSLHLRDVKFRIAILPLIQGKVVVNYLNVEHADYAYIPSDSDPKAVLRKQLEGLALPCQIDLHHFKITRLELRNRQSGSIFVTGAMGKIALRRDLQAFRVELNLFSPKDNRSYFDAYFSGSELRDLIEAKIHAELSFAEGKVDSHFNVAGPWATFRELLYDLPLSGKPVSGTWKGQLSDVHLPHHALLNRDWKFQGDFSVLSGQEVYLKKLLLMSDLVHLKAKGNLNRDIEKTKIAVAYSFPELADFNAFSKIPLKGSLSGKAYYRKGAFKASFQTKDLHLAAFAAGQMQGVVKGNYLNGEWEGEAQFASPGADLPFEGHFAAEYLPGQSFSLTGFNIKMASAVLKGYFSCLLPERICDAALTASAEHLEAFDLFFKDENLGGNINAECTFSSENEAHLALTGKNLRFREYLLEDLNLNAKIENLFEDPAGHFDLLAGKVYTPGFFLDSLHFSTHSDEDLWPFALETGGEIENPFHAAAKGFWRKENSLFSLEIDDLSGDLAEVPFGLNYPTSLEWGADYLTFSPLDFQIGDGQFYSTFEFTPVRSFGKWELKHFPLEILRCLRPRFQLHGFTSSEGFFDATAENIQGTSKIILEEIDVLHLGRKDPFRAKGVLQAHLDQKMLQLYADLYGTDQQFLDFAASLPVEYQLYPFRFNFDETKNASAELTAEGHLQDLFDFVNLGTNYFTGLISCHLFLSNTLAAPSLLGKLEWQKGTYENYFTGIALKNIEAEFEAHKDVLRLVKLKADDDKKGSMTAEGKLFLEPKKGFLFAFDAELHNLHALGFDMIDSNLTGPLYLSGNMEKMLAQGNFLIEEAKIQLNERLPHEIPTMPFTYVNRPSYLYSRTAKPHQNFIFSLDMELTADNNVIVEGRGLKAELEGNLHLYGNNTNIAASGDLKLIKGEYQFAGKHFKLTEGEIVFNDKPAPSAYLNLNGTLDLPDATITVMLRGPLTSPQLTFQSNPQKPTSSILALILFNKDIADISHPEAVQLASTLVSLSGGAGPDVLESIRKSIGVDRLNISSKPGTDELALQIGKYLTRGLMITLSQSATSSQVIVEVELPRGFVFQAETQDEEEGKFSLKWTKSY
jgi:hypothetical protein